MSSFNKITIVGYLGRDPELRYTPSGDPVCNFSVATTEKRKDATGEPREITTWFKVTVWGRSAEACNEYLSKGSQVYVEGRLSQQEYNDRAGNQRTSLEVRASDVQFLSTRTKDEEAEGRDGHREPTRSRPATVACGDRRKVTKEESRAAMIAQGADDDDIPF